MKTILIFKRSIVKYYSQSKQRPVSGKDFSFIHSSQKKTSKGLTPLAVKQPFRDHLRPPKTTDGCIMIHKSSIITVKE